MAKQTTDKKVYKKGVKIKLPISKHIETNFKDYALYVLESRGIPSWYDGLTNVQRYILNNAPGTFQKTLSLVGSCFSDGYPHGDASLGSAITKLARPYGSGEQLLLGDGFFGNALSNEAAAPRYTQIKINPLIKNTINEYSYLNSKHPDGHWNPLHLRYPIGLLTSIIGIAVGYSTTILPRSIEDIEKYQRGKIKELVPHFKNFGGKITRFNNMDRSWLIEGNIVVDKSKREIKISELPPIMKYESFIKKLDKIVSRYENSVVIYNDSQSNIDITIKFKIRNDEAFSNFVEDVGKSIKMIVTENIVLIKDGVVIVYDKIEDYINDYKWRIAWIDWKSNEHFLNVNTSELEYQRAKLEYLEFMLETKRTDSAISKFLGKFPKTIGQRLDKIILRKLSTNEITSTKKEIGRLEKEVEKLIKTTNSTKMKFQKMEDPTIKRGLKQSKKQNINLFDDSDFDNYEGIEVFSAEEDDNDTD